MQSISRPANQAIGTELASSNLNLGCTRCEDDLLPPTRAESPGNHLTACNWAGRPPMRGIHAWLGQNGTMQRCTCCGRNAWRAWHGPCKALVEGNDSFPRILISPRSPPKH
eukprot:355524-Chlamydomonas_euryale.AAC.9